MARPRLGQLGNVPGRSPRHYSPGMTDPLASTSGVAARLLVQLAQAANPLTVVKHGRREDRAVAYDRFIQACTRAVRDRDRYDGISDVWSTWQTINLRADKTVRAAAAALANRVMAVADPGALGEWNRFTLDAEYEFPREDLEREFGVDLSRDDETLFMLAMADFIRIARRDLLRGVWHSVMPAPLRNWILDRK